MATLETNLKNAFTRVATECKALRTLVNGNLTDLSSLTTTTKTSLVAAINELQQAIAAVDGASINDTLTGTTTTWSSTKINSEISTALNTVLDGAPTALDTLNELAAAIGDDASFASTVTTSLGNRVRFDAAQTLSAGQKTQACANLGIGEPDTDFTTTFTSGLV